jgi:hypothetical protein
MKSSKQKQVEDSIKILIALAVGSLFGLIFYIGLYLSTPN